MSHEPRTHPKNPITLHLSPAMAESLLHQLQQQLTQQPDQHLGQPSHPVDDDSFVEHDPQWRDHLPQLF
jgi:hypothetical protein